MRGEVRLKHIDVAFVFSCHACARVRWTAVGWSVNVERFVLLMSMSLVDVGASWCMCESTWVELVGGGGVSFYTKLKLVKMLGDDVDEM
eukprot:gene5504-165_t